MDKRQKVLLSILFFGLILSSMFGINYNVANGFEFRSFWYTLFPFKLIDYAGSSEQSYLSSHIFGYIIYALFGILLAADNKGNRSEILITIFYLLMVFYSLYFEGNAILQDARSEYSGQYLWIGTMLFLLGLFIFNKRYKALTMLRKNKHAANFR